MILKEQHQLRKIRKGDIDAFEKLFFSFYPGLLRYAETLVRKSEIAEEIVQDVFYNVWKNRDSIRITQSWKSYLYRAVYNNSMMYLRKRRREFSLEESLFTEQEGDSPDPFQELEYQEVSAIVSDILGVLPERTREIFLLNRQEGLKYREIAEQLSISVKTVEANMGKALKALRSSLEKYRNE
ncbi:MAG: RNA polymerase sigma-70 factor [Bacteroidetes bacterium]|nr:RNA polymerase sigma-70 factor [Bacteroidota bacterium]